MVIEEKEHLRNKEDLVKDAEKIIQDWANLETIITTISSRFLGDIEVNDAINSSLRDLGILSGSSHASLFIFSKDKKLMNNTHEWCAEGVESQKGVFQKLKTKSFPWWMKQLINGKIINISNTSNLPKDAQSIREILKIQKIKSALIYPLFVKSELTGFAGFFNIFNFYKWTEIDSSLLRISSQIIGNAFEKGRIESLLKESKESYELILENINDLVCIINLKFQFEFINEKSLNNLLGYQKEEIIGKNSIDFVHREDVDKFVNLLNNKFKEIKSKVEIRFNHKDFYWKWFECKAQSFTDKDKKIKWFIISKDINEKKIAEERYKILFDNSPNAILLIDFDGKIIDTNTTIERLFGDKKEFFVDKNINDLNEIFNLDLRLYFKQIFKASFTKNFPEPIEVPITNNVGEKFWIETRASTIKHGSNILIQLILEDITERKRRELLEKKFKEKLEKKVQERTKDLNESFAQQKLYFDQIVKSSQFKTEFMATMSHELRTPLNAIIGFAELLLEGVYGQLNEEQKDFVSDIKSSAEHQFDMIKHILDISKIESGQITLNIQNFSLNNVVEQIKSSLKPLYSKKDLKFKIKGLEEEKYIYSDPIRFREILLNLLSNAIKFTIEGKITLVVREKYNYWLFKVTDTGIGIARKDFPLIFKEFKRVDSTYVRSVPGTGLGLSLTKRLIELHEGEISFTSALGIGTTFTFSISKKLEEKCR